jgi:hypothetical protein
MSRPEEDPELMKAVNEYLSANGLSLPDDVRFAYGIDCVIILKDKNHLLRIGLPPVSNYPVEETEHTDKYLRPRKERKTA